MDINPQSRLDVALGTIEALRKLADHIEQHGPAVIRTDSSMKLDYEFAQHQLYDRGLDGPMQMTNVLRQMNLTADLRLLTRGGDHPRKGLKLTRAEDGTFVRWNGEQPRPPLKGEYCIRPDVDDAVGYVRKARSNYKLPYFIYNSYVEAPM